jgi:Yip1 domain.
MEVQGVRINELVSQSMVVITKPSVESFERFEKSGGKREALVYVLVAAALSGIVSAIFGLFGGISGILLGLISGFVIPVVGFYVFAYVLNFMGKQRGGTGTEDEVFYTCALYTAPLQAINGIVSGIPFLGFLLSPILLIIGLYQCYLGYLASRSSMNLQQNDAIISVVVAIVVQFIVTLIVAGVLGFIVA